jgi:hypothetical protein
MSTLAIPWYSYRGLPVMDGNLSYMERLWRQDAVKMRKRTILAPAHSIGKAIAAS